jgi:uncharacterized protein (DUF1015 family)
MTKIRPFSGLRPLPEYAKEIASLPYDVMDTEEARLELAKHPLSFLRVTKSEATMSDCIDPKSPAVYKMARQNLERYVTEKEMKQDSSLCYYIYRQRMEKNIQIGLVAAASVEEYREGIIKKHELTRTDKEQDRVNHIITTMAQTGPVFLTYKNRVSINAYILKLMSEKKPVYDFIADDGVQNTLYVVDQLLEVAELTRLFEEVPAFYIADGHHRCAGAMRVADMLRGKPGEDADEEYEHFLAVIFPDNMMHIMDYNRLVKDLCGMTEAQFLEKLQDKFTVEEVPEGKNPKPKARHTFALYLKGKWYALKAKTGSFAENDIISSLDVSILQTNVLTPLLEIGDPRTDERINFVGGIRGLSELVKRVDSGEYKLAFAMYPTSMSEVMQVADEGKIMPPKSTWFEPKLRDGLVVHLIGKDEGEIAKA